MPKQVLVEAYNDFRGGRNTSYSPDLLDDNELVDSTNARVTTFGAILKRTGSRRMHTTAIGSAAAVRGVTQWDQAGTNQTVAIAGGKLYHKTTDFGEFTEVTPGVGDEFSTTLPAYFQPFRASSSGAPLHLYIASGGKYYDWDGSTLTRIDGVSSAPPAHLLTAYHTRIFAVDRTNFPKHLYWSVIGDPEDFTAGTITQGGSNIVDLLSGDEIEQLETVGSSLIIATADSIVRFTGYSSEDIQIAQDTEGVSADIGVVGGRALKRIETFAACLSDRGPYLVVEAGVQNIGAKVEFDFDNLSRANIGNAVVGHHRQRREIWFAVTGTGDSNLNKTVYVFNYRLQAWSGPFTYSFGINDLYRYEDSNGDEWLMAGCSDGFVRHMDIGALDDVLADGSGGSTYTMTVELKPIFFDTGPGIRKILRRANVQADLTSSTALVLKFAWDAGGLSSYNVTWASNNVQNHRIDASDEQGERLRVQFVDASSDIPIINGLVLEAYQTGRYT